MRRARSRMLWGQISISPRVNSLSVKACLLYTWLLAHADDQGRMSADAKAIKGAVCPMRDDITVGEIPDLLTEMQGQGLILWYPAEVKSDIAIRKVPVLQIANWWDYQNLNKPQTSQYPPPPNWEDHVSKLQSRNESGRFVRGTQ